MKIHFGIVGCGNIGSRHAKHVNNHPEAVLTTVYDKDPAKAKKVAEEFGAEVAESYEALIKDERIDIINVCTPNGLHKQHTIEALTAKKHVLVEKPMALKRTECEEMINCAMKNNQHIYVVKQNRFNPPIVALKNLIESGKLGEVYNVNVNCFWNRNENYYNTSNWKGDAELDGGTLFTQFSHFVDIFYYLFGGIEDIHGHIKNVSHGDMIDFEDTGCFNFMFKSGALGSFNYTTSSFEKNMEGSITVFAENATIKVGGQYLNTIDYQKTKDFDITDLPQAGTPNDYGTYQGSMSNHDKVIENVVDTLNGRSQIMTNAMEGMKVVDIIQQMYQAAKHA